MLYKLFGQCDPRWANKELAPGMTCAGLGCLVTSLCMGLPNLGINILPDEFIDLARSKKGIGQSGELKGEFDWSALPRMFGKIKLYRRQNTTAHPAKITMAEQVATSIQRLDKAVERGQIAIVHVDAINHDDWPDHFCLYIGGGVIHDPFYNDKIHLAQRYGGPEQAIKGYAIVCGEPAEAGGDPHVAQAVGKLFRAQSQFFFKDQMINEAIEALMGV